ncbi:ABC transporter ATP-binding protein [Vibrio splendidus]
MSSDSSSLVVKLENISFRWKPELSPTLEIPSLHIQTQEHLFIKGPSGCGKSTLLGLLTGINQTDQGEVSILGQDLTQLTPRQRDKFRADHIGYIFQQFNLLPYLSVIDNVTLPCQFSTIRKQQVTESQNSLQATAQDLLLRLKLPQALMDKPVTELSIGQQQRVAAARALIGQPKIIIADEPTSALDHDNREAFIELLLEQANQAGSTLIFVSHDPTLEKLFTRTIDLKTVNQAKVVV